MVQAARIERTCWVPVDDFVTTGRVERRLAAIMVADIVGYSRLIETDEAKTLAAIRRLRTEVIDPLLTEHRGRVVKLMGDGVIVEFGSAVDAVACAVSVQQKVAVSHGESAPKDRIIFRIGINLGDVVVDGEDLLGDGMNIAARLEALAEPGGICISDTVQRQLAGKTSSLFEDMGERRLKNIERPVRVWSWASGAAPVFAAPLPLPEKPSIAVLPFDNLSGQPEESYFSDGITEDILTGLARFRSIFVIARNSSFAFRGKSTDLAEIGRRLGVAYLLEGSVRRAGDRIRITAQLIEAKSGAHIWADRYDRKLDDVFLVQDEVGETIVATLVGRLEEARLQQSLRKPPASLAAYECLLRGIAHFRGYADDDNQKAYAMFERAIALDPRYALAHAYRALVWVGLHGHAAAPADVLDTAFAMASHALELDPLEGGCHRTLGLIWMYRRDFDRAEHHFRRALELNPNNADRRIDLGNLLTMRGRPEEGLDLMYSAVRLNPINPTWYNPQLGIALYSLRRYEDAAQAFGRVPNPGYWSRARLVACYGQLGDAAAAQAQVAAILSLRPSFSVAEFIQRDVMLERAEDREHLREGLLKAGMPE